MEDNLIEILSTFGYPVYRQGSLSNTQKYPETFFTFWNNSTPNHAHYDNSEYGFVWNFNIFVYSSNNALTYSLLDEARSALKTNGWIPIGKGFDAASDEPTHTGRGLELNYLDI